MSVVKVLVGCATKDKFGYLQHSLPHNRKLAGKKADWLIIDDGSQDQTSKYLENLKVKENNLDVVTFPKSQGISYNKNHFFDSAKRKKYDYLVLIDDDILLSYNWLSELILTVETSETIGIVAPFIINDLTMFRNLNNFEPTGYEVGDYLVPVSGLGGACTLIRPQVYEKLCYNQDMASYTFADANFHGRVIKAGWDICVNLLVSAVHLPWIVMLDQEQEFKKLKIRHDVRKLPEASFEESKRKMLNRTLNPHIKGLCKCSK